MGAGLIYSPFFWSSIVLVVVSVLLWLKLKATRQELEEASTHDHVSHALEWPHLEERAGQMVKHCQRYKQSISFLMLDGDHFRRIHDEHGPEAGQEALVILATAVGEVIREVDLFGRYSSGKFVVCLPATDLNGAVILAERMRQTVASIKPRKYASHYTVSIGCGELQPQEKMADVIKRTNQALERARNNGGNRVAASKNHEAKSHKNAVWPNLKKL